MELALDPIELRVRNEPQRDPESGEHFSSRGLLECLHEGARRFGWAERDPAPGARRDGRWLLGNGVAASTYPARTRPSEALARRERERDYVVAVSAADIGTGARTALTQIAAEALGVGPEGVRVELGDSALPAGPVAGDLMGTASWGTAVHMACERLRDTAGPGEVRVDSADALEAREPYAATPSARSSPPCAWTR